jgi:hypothetical protein
MTTLKATRKLMRVKDDGSKIKMTFDVQVNCTTGLITVNSQPVGYDDKDDGLGYASVYEHFSLMMTEVRKMDIRNRKANGTSLPDPCAQIKSKTPSCRG